MMLFLKVGVVGDKLHKAVVKSITPPLPRRIKRLLTIASIVGVLKHSSIPDEALIRKLNSVFHLDYKSAWLLPMRAHGLIWKFKDTDSISVGDQKSVLICNLGYCHLAEFEISDVVDYFYKLTPKWLRYGSEQLMRRDIHSAITSLQQTS